MFLQWLKQAKKPIFTRGFTIMEFALVAGLMGYLAVLAAHEIARSAVDKKIERTVWQVKLITEALDRYHMDNEGFIGLVDLNTMCTSSPRYLIPYVCVEDSPIATAPNPYILTNITPDTATLKIPVDENGHAEKLKNTIELEDFGSIISITVYPDTPHKVWVNYDLQAGDPPD